jgi:hypothetical protein
VNVLTMPSAAMCLNIGFRASGTGISLDVFTLRLTSGDHVSDAWFAALAIEWAASGSPSIVTMRGSRD